MDASAPRDETASPPRRRHSTPASPSADRVDQVLVSAPRLSQGEVRRLSHLKLELEELKQGLSEYLSPGSPLRQSPVAVRQSPVRQSPVRQSPVRQSHL